MNTISIARQDGTTNNTRTASKQFRNNGGQSFSLGPAMSIVLPMLTHFIFTKKDFNQTFFQIRHGAFSSYSTIIGGKTTSYRSSSYVLLFYQYLAHYAHHHLLHSFNHPIYFPPSTLSYLHFPPACSLPFATLLRINSIYRY
ncbi:hypothetical protein J0A71_09g18920 [Encephalitozoon cuniculi]|nr:hypothetical protein J0A71_09g18920 [Encephalitozoon cuniculi]